MSASRISANAADYERKPWPWGEAMKWPILFLLWPCLAAAEWLPLTAGPDKAIYVENQRILRAGTSVRAWVLTDYEQALLIRGTGAYSEVALWEVNCQEQTATMRQVTSYDDHMGKGHSVETTLGDGEWRSATPNSIGHAVMTVACSSPSPN
jgi:hypothetical protein